MSLCVIAGRSLVIGGLDPMLWPWIIILINIKSSWFIVNNLVYTED